MSGIVRATVHLPQIRFDGSLVFKKQVIAQGDVASIAEARRYVDQWKRQFYGAYPEGMTVEYQFIPLPIDI